MSVAVAIAVQIVSFALTAMPRFPADDFRRYYTVQILATPAENKPALLKTYVALREKGYLVYCCRSRVEDRDYLRLRTGVFENASEAKTYAGQFKEKGGFDGFVTEANPDVVVARFKGQFDVITTPSGIWLKSAASVRELYRPARNEIDTEKAGLQISPDGTAVAFHDANRIVRVALDTGKAQVLKQAAHDDDLLNVIVRWSPEGKYLAYLDAPEWELPTKLWIMRADGAEDRCLVNDKTGGTKVKSFLWHPTKNRIFYVCGPTHGTVSAGGGLFYTDPNGNQTQIVAASPKDGTEVLGEFRLAHGFLHYRIAHFDPNGQVQEYTVHKRAISDLN